MKFFDYTIWDHTDSNQIIDGMKVLAIQFAVPLFLTDPNQMIDGMKILANHYAVSLSKHGFSIEKAKMEFCDLKGLANRSYSSFMYIYVLYSFFISVYL